MVNQPQKRTLRQSLEKDNLKWILYWVIITLNANLIGFNLINKLPQLANGIIGYYILTTIGAILLGLFVSTLQRWLISIRIPNIKKWIPITTIAYVIFLVGFNLMIDQIHLHSHQLAQYEPLLAPIINSFYGNIRLIEFLYITSINITFGLAVGTAQWFLLRKKRKNAAWWILIHFLCTFFASLFGYRTDGEALSISTFFVIYPILSGLAMDVWFKIRIPQENPQTPNPIYQGSNNGID